MRLGYWLPVFGGWLRNVADENMEASWSYVKRLAQRSEQIGFDLTLIAELNLNDIKGVDAPSLDAWSTAAALAAITERVELMVAVRPTFHQPALLATAGRSADARLFCLAIPVLPDAQGQGAFQAAVRAEEARHLAEQMSDPEARAMMLRIAADHERLAENAQRRAARGDRKNP